VQYVKKSCTSIIGVNGGGGGGGAGTFPIFCSQYWGKIEHKNASSVYMHFITFTSIWNAILIFKFLIKYVYLNFNSPLPADVLGCPILRTKYRKCPTIPIVEPVRTCRAWALSAGNGLKLTKRIDTTLYYHIEYPQNQKSSIDVRNNIINHRDVRLFVFSRAVRHDSR